VESLDQVADSWSRIHRVAFRFAFIYLVLYNLPFPLGTLPHTVRAAQTYESLWDKVVPWIGNHLLSLHHEIVISNNCSGDTTYDYLRVLCSLGLACVGSLVWSLLDRSHSEYERLHHWLRTYVRLSVGAALIMYGADKIFLVHFPPPNLYKLLEPLGNYSRMSLLWTFTGASRNYTVFAGSLQLLGGVLLFVPRLTTLGALIDIAVFSNILALNFGYDLPVKLYTLHVLILCFFLVLPDGQRLLRIFVLNQSIASSPESRLFKSPGWNTVATVAQLMLGGVLVCLLLSRAHDYEKRTFGAESKSPLYGIWTVDEFMVDGRVLPPLSTDDSRWKRVVFQFPNQVGIQSMNDSWVRYWLREDTAKNTVAIGSLHESNPAFEFVLSKPDSRSLTLAGRDIRVKLHRLDETQFAILDRGFHWIDEDTALVMDEERVCDRVRRPGQEVSLWRQVRTNGLANERIPEGPNESVNIEMNQRQRIPQDRVRNGNAEPIATHTYRSEKQADEQQRQYQKPGVRTDGRKKPLA
jgi:uncharacterized membrane protein YphA (DoxX/SURF4 family)